MPVDYENASTTSTATLISGVVDDVQNLVKQQFQLARKEIERDIRKGKEAFFMFVGGGSLLLLAMFEFTLAIAHWIHWFSSPVGTEAASLPLWGCHAIVAGVFGILGSIVLAAASKIVSTIDPMNGPTAESLKENIE